ncbi:hypothetical protein DRQ25_17955 [Candidatus Fermentibacteria bacterium]|nr:MAG: hypothetical protein DRQ25_17955 [Candidatus Fermentibacteria bacterium]
MKIILLLVLPFIVAVCLADPVLDLTLTAPDGNITGLGYGGGYLWALDKTSKTVYKLDPLTGSIEHSWVCTQTGSKIPTGLTYMSGYIYVCAGTSSGTSAYGYMYNSTGGYIKNFSIDC